jgi:hypothetical protein
MTVPSGLTAQNAGFLRANTLAGLVAGASTKTDGGTARKRNGENTRLQSGASTKNLQRVQDSMDGSTSTLFPGTRI